MPDRIYAQPATAYIQGQQQGQQSRLNQMLINRAPQQTRQNELNLDISAEQLARMREKGATEQAQQKAANEAQILGSILGLPPDQQEAAFYQLADRFDPNTLKLFTDSTGQVKFDPRRAQLVQNMAVKFSQTDRQTLEERIIQQLPQEERQGAYKQLFDKKVSGDSKKVQSSKILPGGLTQIVYDDGTVETKQPKEAEQELIKSAEKRGAELQGLRSGEREEAKNAAKQAVESFKSLSLVKRNIGNMEEGIKLLDQGAGTGVIERRLPSVRASSIKLDNLQGRLGLDVIGNTTFGALSEAELRFALDTALPTGLGREELKKWMQEKIDAQTKLADYLEEAALFLGEPGNTIADFLAKKKSEKPQEQSIGRFKIEVVD